ncbi:electron transport complex subunit RsxC [Bacterioplanoides pacificum]|uniref:Ion-translocating oxidoreductase complex subunit C n=1 Tax=Bacterioplanoides pacificum TaxID=1171596 RepID=A0ABV7VT13_9GAMM
MSKLIRLYDFDGGIHPRENKQQSTQQPIQTAPIAPQLTLPLHQHIGAEAVPVVEVGERVLKGQLLAEADGFVSVPLHAPTSGVISAIEHRQVPHASGLEALCIVLDSDGQDQWCEHPDLLSQLGADDLSDLSASDLIQHISRCGIAGMGGAGFPTAVKLHSQQKIDTLIINGAECEPYITADDMLMRERARDVVSGAQVLLHILGASRCMIGVEDNKPEAISALNAALVELHEQHHIQVVAIPTKYPSGGEKQLIQILTGQEVPAGGIPANLGIVCQNVGTAAAISQAVYQGKPLISRITTVTGDANQQPGNWEVLLGTPVSFLLQQGGYQPQPRPRVIMGGPMMGFALPQLELPVVKTTNCLLAPTDQELPPNDIAMACIRCGMCADACPAELLPQQLYWFSKAQEFDKAEQHNLFDCIECGACSYVCPSHIPLVQYYRYAKGAVREERAAQAKAEKAKERFENRLARQEREKAEKEAKRKARAEAATQAQSAKKAAPAAASENSAELEKLQKQLDGAQAALKKTQEKLDNTREDAAQAEKIPAFEAALEKTQSKIKDLALQIASAKKAAKATPPATDTDKGDPNSPERLQKKWQTAQARLETAQKRLAQAQEQGLDTVAALQEGIAKQQLRVDDAKAAYDASLAGGTTASTETTSGATTFDAATLEKLQKQLAAAQTAKSKTEEKLTAAREDPQQANKVASFEAALAKTQDKIKDLAKQIAAEKKAQKAATTAQPAASPDADPRATLKKKILAQSDRLEKAQERLNMAQQQGLDTVTALQKAVDKQADKLTQLEADLNQLSATEGDA